MDTNNIDAIIGAIATITAACITAALGAWFHHRYSRKEAPTKSKLKDRSDVSYPAIQNRNSLSKNEVCGLVQFYGLFRRWSTNPHLSFREGDVSYWYEQELTERDLCREFESRRTILEMAEEQEKIIENQGDLSHRAQQVQASKLGDKKQQDER
jgi:hypothetical protein